MNRYWRFLVGLAVLASSIGAQADHWPFFRGPTRQGVSTGTGFPIHWSATSNVVWKTAMPGEGWSSPIVHGDSVFVTAATEEGLSLRLIHLDRATGAIRWDREVCRQTKARIQRPNSYATPTPATDGERIYVLSFNGRLAALNYEGRMVWQNTDFPYYSQHGPGVSPVLHGDLLIVPFDGSSEGPDRAVGWQKPWDRAFILGLDRATGRVRWRAERGSSRIAHVTPNIMSTVRGDILVSGAGDVLQGFDLGTGRRLWSVSGQGEGVVPSIVIGDGLIFHTTGFGQPRLRAVRPEDGQARIVWEISKNVPMIPSALFRAPYLFAINEGGTLQCLEARTGKELWSERLPGHYAASPVLAEDRLYILSEEGETSVIEAGPAYRLLARNPIEAACRASPALADGRIYLRTERHLFCLGQREASRSPSADQVGQEISPWTPGTLEIHQISTGRGNAALMIFPDGTTMLVDAGELGAKTVRHTPDRPDGSRPAGEWITRYILHALRHNPSPVLGYGSFDYYNGADIPGVPGDGRPEWHDVETPVAQVVGPVEAAILDHHGYLDSQNAFLVSALRPRVWVISVWDSAHPTGSVWNRLQSQRLYPGPRDVFATDAHDAALTVIGGLNQLSSQHGHIVIRVEPGGDRYRVLVVDDSSESHRITKVSGPFASNR